VLNVTNTVTPVLAGPEPFIFYFLFYLLGTSELQKQFMPHGKSHYFVTDYIEVQDTAQISVPKTQL
jgi:hypothetical protein